MNDILSLLSSYANLFTLASIIAYFLIFFFTKNSKIISTIPSFCTGIGVFFTFVVLYDNLAIQEIQINNSSELTSDFAGLIKKLTSAFSTSIIGVGSSLILNPLVKWRIEKIEKYIFTNGRTPQVIAALNSHPHELLYQLQEKIEMLNVSINQLQGNEGEKKNLSDVYNILNSFSTNTIKRVNELFENLGRNLDERISSLSGNAIEDAKANVESINAQFIESTSKVLKENSQFLSQLVETQKNSASESATNLSKIQTELLQRISFFEEKSKIMMDSINQSFGESVQTMGNTYKEEAKEIKKVYENVYSSVQEMETKIQEQSQLILNQHLSKLEASFQKLEDFQLAAQNNLETTTAKFAKAVNQYEDTRDNNIELGNKIQSQIESIDNLSEQSKRLLEQWSKMNASVEELEDHVAKVNNTITHFNEIKEHLRVNGASS